MVEAAGRPDRHRGRRAERRAVRRRRGIELDADETERLRVAELGGEERRDRAAPPVEAVVAGAHEVDRTDRGRQRAGDDVARRDRGGIDADGPSRARGERVPEQRVGLGRTGGDREHGAAGDLGQAQRPLERGAVRAGRAGEAGVGVDRPRERVDLDVQRDPLEGDGDGRCKRARSAPVVAPPGDHAGRTSSAVEVDVRRRMPVPSAFTTQMFSRPLRVLWKASCVPSGDQVGVALVRGAVGEPPGGRSVRVHRPEVVVAERVAGVGDLGRIGRQRGRVVVGRGVREPLQADAVRPDGVDVTLATSPGRRTRGSVAAQGAVGDVVVDQSLPPPHVS